MHPIGTQADNLAGSNLGLSSPSGQPQAFETAWAHHEPNYHPSTLKLHVERRTNDAQKLTFRQMCGETAFIPESELTTVKKAGSGSFAQVEIAKYHPVGQAERLVAVKRLKSNAAVDIATFASEANILRKLKHRNIVGYIGVGCCEDETVVKKQSKSSCYMVQEFMNGGNLKQKIFRQSNLPYPIYSDHDAVQWGRQIAEGLAYLHSANPLVLHRDLKLENILLNAVDENAKQPEIEAKICDFGLAVSLLDPHFTFRQENQQQLPSGLASPRIDSAFHEQMAMNVAGGEMSEPLLAQQADRMRQALASNLGSPVSATKLRNGSRAFSFSQRESSAVPLRRKQQFGDPGDLDALRRNSVSVAELAHGRVKPPERKSPAAFPSATPVKKETPKKAMTRTMSKTGQNLQSRGAVGTKTHTHDAYHLTGRAGSFLYMSPEVIMCQPYNEKADVFSLGVILFELFLRKTLATVVMELDNSPGQIEMFAYQVAGGYRHPIPQSWPEELRQLISDCWNQNPDKRPETGELARRLSHLEDSELFRKWETVNASKSGLSNCCTIQ